MLKELILDYLRQQPDVPVDKLADPAAKMGELGLDSLGLVEMLFEIEDKYGFQIEEPMRYAEAFVAAGAGILTLHVETLYGENNHHIVESCFKALARALRHAVEIDPRAAQAVPSTKGQL